MLPKKSTKTQVKVCKGKGRQMNGKNRIKGIPRQLS